MTLAVVGTTAFGIDVHTLEAAPDSPEGRKGAALLEASTTMFSQGVPGNLSLWLYAALALEPLFEVVRALATLLPDPCLKRGLAARRLVSALCQDLIDAARARLPPSPSTSSGDSGDRGSKGGAASASGGKKSGKPAGTSGGRQGGSQRQQAPSSLLSAAGPSAGVADETDGVIVDRGFLTTLLTVHDKVDGSKLSDPRIIAQAMTFFLAGYETTANALAYTIYCVSRHPDVQDRLLQEIDAVTGGRARSGSGKAAGSGGGGGSSDLLPQSAVVEADLPLLVYTEAVIKEALRLYPPAISSQRQPAEDVVVGGLVIPAGTTLHLPLLNLHLNPEYWPQPLAFLPDRFMPGGYMT